MTDEQKELVVLAAKAMGYEIRRWVEYSSPEFFAGEGYECTSQHGLILCWNPLTSDSDCFRMETELGITVGYGLTGFIESYKLDERGYVDIQFYEEIGSDKAAARRLASTKVAAEIQRRKESKG